MAEDERLAPRRDAIREFRDLAAIFTSVSPVLEGAVSNVLGGVATQRKIQRMEEVLKGVADDLAGVKSKLSEEYVKTEDFEDLLEETLRRAARERSEEKRRIYRDFIVSAIRHPGETYDAQLELLQIVGQLSSDHIRVLRALLQQPSPEPQGLAGSPLQTLSDRLPDLDRDRIAHFVQRLNDLRLTNLQNLNTMMTARGAADLRQTVTALGQRVLGLSG
jgi:hypothetical protein